MLGWVHPPNRQEGNWYHGRDYVGTNVGSYHLVGCTNHHYHHHRHDDCHHRTNEDDDDDPRRGNVVVIPGIDDDDGDVN